MSLVLIEHGDPFTDPGKWSSCMDAGKRKAVISCPTCGRCQIDLIPLAESIEKKTRQYKTPLKVAVMGCVVNGPGEASAADIGITGGDGLGLLFKKGKIIKKFPEDKLEEILLTQIEKLTGGK